MCVQGDWTDRKFARHTHTKKHAPAHLFSLTGEERDDSPQDAPLFGGQVCIECVSLERGSRRKVTFQNLRLCVSASSV